jgi:hypothetical protein
MRKLPAFLLLMVPAWFCITTVPAQETSGGIIFSRYRQFRIPFNSGTSAGRLKQLQLYVSTDQGRSWQASVSAPPEQGHFQFNCNRDGYYWFTVQTQDTEGRLYPASLDGAAPSLKVAIDTQPPTVNLQALAPRNGEIGISWDIRDDNLDLSAADAVRLEYRPTGSSNWLVVTIPAGATQTFWNPTTNAPVEVRLRARDRAGNVGEATTTVNSGGTGGFFGGNQPTSQQPTNSNNVPSTKNDHGQALLNRPSPSELRYIGSKRVSLNYELQEVGRSGVSTIELWYTEDGRNWTRYLENSGSDNQKSIVWLVASDGVYGITLVAKSGVGLGDRPPQTGDRPQMWIEVDTEKPEVKILPIAVGTGLDKGKLNITWSASDKNLATNPITLSYAEQFSGPWKSIANKLPNSGQYIWTMPDNVPYQFHLKVEAVDRAGNIGDAVTDSLIKVDLAQPKARILTVGPAGN